MMPAPHSRMCWSMRAPSLDTNHFCVSQIWYSASATSAPCSTIVVVAPTIRSPLSASDTASGSIRHSLAHEPDAGSPGTRPAAAPATRALAAAVRAACPPAARGRRQVGHGVEAPPRPDERTHAHAGVLDLHDVVDVAVAGGHRLVAAVHHPGVGVARSCGEGGIDRCRGGIELGHPVHRRACDPSRADDDPYCCAMSIAITDDHSRPRRHRRRLPDQARGDAPRRGRCSRPRPRRMPTFYAEAADLGWLGLHVPEEHGGSGFGLEELVVVVEQLGRAVAPGAFVPTVMASAVLAAAGTDDLAPATPAGSRRRLRPAAPSRSVATSSCATARCTVRRGAVLGAGLADVLLVPVGDDVAVVDARGEGVSRRPRRRTSTRRAAPARWRSTAPPRTSFPGARQVLDRHRPHRCSPPRRSASPASAPSRRPTTPRCASSSAARSPRSRRSSTTAPTCSSPPSWRPRPCGTPPAPPRPAATSSRSRRRSRPRSPCRPPTCAPSSTSRCTAASDSRGSTTPTSTCAGRRRSRPCVDAEQAAVDATDLTRAGVRRERSVDLPPEAEAIRDEVQAFVAEVEDLDARRAARPADRRPATRCRTGPRRGAASAGAVEQLVIEQEFAAAGIERPTSASPAG